MLNFDEKVKFAGDLFDWEKDISDLKIIDFNSENGKKFGISKDSEIVNYCEDGYISYTFHVVDAMLNARVGSDVTVNVTRAGETKDVKIILTENDIEEADESLYKK